MELITGMVGLPTRALQIWLLLLRHETKLTQFLLSRLRRSNERSTRPVTAPSGPVVSLTSHGERLESVHLVLESIATGSVLPSRLILWVENAEFIAHPTPGLERLVKRGLEIRLSAGFGPHTKYYPYLLETEKFDRPLVTADDDLLYSRWWLEGLVSSNRDNPDVVNCYRAHKMRIVEDAIQPYRNWTACESSSPSYLHFATGVSGCIYPPRLLNELKRAGTEFTKLCPKADDVWLHVNAIRAGFKIRQVWKRSLRFPFVPGTQNAGLYHTNVLRSQNDVQINNTYTARDIAFLESSNTEMFPPPHLPNLESKRT